METLYFDCSRGVGADTIAAALLELTDDKDKIIDSINTIFRGRLGVMIKSVVSMGIEGTGIYTFGHRHEVDDENRGGDKDGSQRHHRVLQDVIDVINTLALDDGVKRDVLGIYNLLADSVANARGTVREKAHLHDLASMDNIIMITTACTAMNEIYPKDVCASPICVGKGYTQNVYGYEAVPTPSTAYILSGIPTFTGKVNGEFCTNIGEAILKWYVKSFKTMPVMSQRKKGCGVGRVKSMSANYLRVYYGNTISNESNGEMTELVCVFPYVNAGRLIALQERLVGVGVEDILFNEVRMMDAQPGFQLSCLCDTNDADKVSRILLKHTGAAFVKRSECTVYKLVSANRTVLTRYGSIGVKRYSGYGVEKDVPLYKDVKNAAMLNNIEEDVMYELITNELKAMKDQ